MINYKTIMKEAGLKFTRPRSLVLTALQKANEPLSIKEIYKRVPNRIDLASIYRTIHCFLELGIVREVPLGEGYQRYELVGEGKHYHYVLCVECGKLEDIDICLLEQVEKMTNYKILSHSMEFQGICHRCTG